MATTVDYYTSVHPKPCIFVISTKITNSPYFFDALQQIHILCDSGYNMFEHPGQTKESLIAHFKEPLKGDSAAFQETRRLFDWIVDKIDFLLPCMVKMNWLVVTTY